MIFEHIILQVLRKFQQERTVYAAFHLLRGKKSGQTIQDISLFQLFAYFGLLPQLKREQFDTAIAQLVAEGAIHIADNNMYTLTVQGQACELPIYHFSGWQYRGNEWQFFARVTLVVQTLSQQSAQDMRFIAIVTDDAVQRYVRSYLAQHQFQQHRLQQAIYDEIMASFAAANLCKQSCELLLYRLSGYQLPSLTWQQLAKKYTLSAIDCQLLATEALHQWLNSIFKKPNYPLLTDLAQDIKVEQVLTASAQQTAKLFQEGHSLQQIMALRRLKSGTIEDHFVEMAIHMPDFPMADFISPQQQQAVYDEAQQLQTKKLRVLHEALPELSYFQLRLTLARGGGVQ